VLQMATLWRRGMLLALSAVRPEHLLVPKMALFWLITLVLPLALRSVTRAFAKCQVRYL
jgi:hypothetical protein